MKRTLLLLLVLIAVLSAVFLIQNKDNSKIEALKNERDFKVPSDEVTKIVVAEKNDRVTTLTKSNDGWLVNGKYPVAPDAIGMLLEATSQIRMQSIPPKAAYENVMNSFAKNGFKVMVYTNNGLEKSYYIGGVTQGERGTYYLMEGSEQPYTMELPHMNGSPRLRFIKDIDYWRDRAIFKYGKNKMKRIQVDFPATKDNSFVLNIEKGKYDLKPLHGATQKIEKKLNNSTVDKFVENMSAVYHESFVNKHEKKDSIANFMEPFAIFTVEDVDGHKREVKFYPSSLVNNTPPEESELVRRYFGFINDDKEGIDFMATQHRMVKGILWTYPQFYF